MIKIFIESNNFDKFSNIYDIVKNSSISISIFAEIIMRINKKNDIENFIYYNLSYDIDNLCEITILNTIKTLKYLKKYLIKNSASINSKKNINDKMILYLSNVFAVKNKNICFDTKIITTIIYQNNWEDTDINLYNLFEKYNLIKYKQRSYSLKNSFTNDIFHIQPDVKGEYIINTISFMIKLASIADLKSTRLYIIYEIYRYMNYFQENNIITSLNRENFQIISVKKAEEFLKQLQNEFITVIPKYFKDILFNELNKYIIFVYANYLMN